MAHLRHLDPAYRRERFVTRNILKIFSLLLGISLIVVQQCAHALTSDSKQLTTPSPFDAWTEISALLKNQGLPGLALLSVLAFLWLILSQAQNLEAVLRLLGRDLKSNQRLPEAASEIQSTEQVEIAFVNSNGENIFWKYDERSDSGDMNRFSVRVHFKLSIPWRARIVDISLHYPRVSGFPGHQKISIDGVSQDIDSSFNLLRTVQVEELCDIIVWREFLSDKWSASNGDYNEFEIMVGFVAAGSTIFRKLNIRGVLAPGGEAVQITKEITNSDN